MKAYNFVFIVLCYVNIDDLKIFAESVKNINGTYKVVVVNSYYDDATKNEFKRIATENDFDFINVPNKGYGFGNNKGIEYVEEKYSYDFIVISNPDVEFHNFDINLLKDMKDAMVGPTIKTLRGKSQNPYKPIKMWLINGLEYYGIKRGFYPYWFVGAAVNKILREVYVFIGKLVRCPIKVYTLHGSCMLIGKGVIEQLKGQPLYDENMFLFSEEEEVGYKAIQNNIKLFYDSRLKILHREDGSTSLIEDKVPEYGRKSYIYCYEKWNR